MAQHQKHEVEKYIRENLEDAIESIQIILIQVCDNDCDDCWFDDLCVEEGCIAEEVVEKKLEEIKIDPFEDAPDN